MSQSFMGDLDDFGELYADLPCVPTAEADEEYENDIEERGAWYENETLNSVNSSDSEDDLQIVLNEDDYYDKLPDQLLAERLDYEEGEEDDIAIVTGPDCSVDRPRGSATKEAQMNWLRPCLTGPSVPGRKFLSRRNQRDILAVPCTLEKASYNLGSMQFLNEFNYNLPWYRSIFDIDVESFECKPWRSNGVDITDFFNFGMNEEGWKTYCNQLLKLNKLTRIVPCEVAQRVCDNGHEIQDFLDNEGKRIRMPKGRAIQVKNSNGDRIPSMDVKRPCSRDCSAAIQITTGIPIEDALDPTINHNTHADQNESKCELLLNFKNELCKSSFSDGVCAQNCEGTSNSSYCSHRYVKASFDEKHGNMNRDSGSSTWDVPLSIPDAILADNYSITPKFSDHTDSFKDSRDEECFEKVGIHVNSDSLLPASFFSHSYHSSESGSETSKTDHTSRMVISPNDFLDLKCCQQTTPCKGAELNLSSDNMIASTIVYMKGIFNEEHTQESRALTRSGNDKLNERSHSSQRGKILLENNTKEINYTAFLARLKDHDNDLSHPIKKEKITTSREAKIRRSGRYINQRAQNKNESQDITSKDYMLLTSGNMHLHDERSYHTRRRRAKDGMIMDAQYCLSKAKAQHRDKYLTGAMRRPQELDSYGKALLINLKRESSADCNNEGSMFYKEDEIHSRNFRVANDETKRGWHDDSHRNRVLTLIKPEKRYSSYRRHLHSSETMSHLRCKHRIISSKKWHSFTKPHLNFDDAQHPSQRNLYLDDCIYRENIASSLALPGLLPKEEASIRYHDSESSSSSKRSTLYGITQHLNDRDDKSLLGGQKIYNYRHNYSGKNLIIRHGKNSDHGSRHGSRVGFLSDKLSNSRIELDEKGCRQEVRKFLNGWKVKARGCTSSKGRSHFGSVISSLKDLGDSNDSKESLHYNLKKARNCYYSTCFKEEYSNHGLTKIPSKHPVIEEETDELEEGQLIEECDHETGGINCKDDGKSAALIETTIKSLSCLSNPNMDFIDQIHKNKLVGRYGGNHLLEALAKMEKRRERFKDPIPLKKESENCCNMLPAAALKDAFKPQRPARKRSWGIS